MLRRRLPIVAQTPNARNGKPPANPRWLSRCDSPSTFGDFPNQREKEFLAQRKSHPAAAFPKAPNPADGRHALGWTTDRHRAWSKFLAAKRGHDLPNVPECLAHVPRGLDTSRQE